MKKLAFLLVAVAAAVAPSAGFAQTVFSDSLQTTLASPNWVGNGSGAIAPSPVAGGNALHFDSLGSGGDLFSSLFATGPGTYRVRFDYLCGTAGGCGGFVGLYPGGSTTTNVNANPGNDGWLWTDTPAAYPTAFTGTGNGVAYTNVTFAFTVTSPGQFGLKLEDFSGSGGVAGDAYFRNLSVAAVPEPATWAMLIFGFGLIGTALRLPRRKGAPLTV